MHKSNWVWIKQHNMQHVWSVITHRPHFLSARAMQFFHLVWTGKGGGRNPVKKGHTDYLLAIRHLRVCVCGCFTGTPMGGALKKSSVLQLHDTMSRIPSLPLIDFNTADRRSTVKQLTWNSSRSLLEKAHFVYTFARDSQRELCFRKAPRLSWITLWR